MLVTDHGACGRASHNQDASITRGSYTCGQTGCLSAYVSPPVLTLWLTAASCHRYWLGQLYFIDNNGSDARASTSGKC
eukprot:42835-Eustigmatos_ZCMA.PRE.1